MLELLFEVFIRPDGYKSLILSEKAFTPETVRYINSLHLTVEAISLGVFVPEFLCILTPTHCCGDKFDFSFMNALFYAILGPARWQAALGRAHLALIRLRIFGLIRHFRKMWINHRLDNTVGKNAVARLTDSTMTGSWPSSNNKSLRHMSPKDSRSRRLSKKGGGEVTVVDQQAKEEALINASNIGTALLVTNTHRTLMILCAIVGLFPLLTTIQTNGGTNRVGEEMAKQLQMTTDTFQNASSPEECAFVHDSLVSWVLGITPGTKLEARQSSNNDDGVFVLMARVDQPTGCLSFLQDYNGVLTSYVCEAYADDLATKDNDRGVDRLRDRCNVWLNTTDLTTNEELAESAGIRTGAIETQPFLVANQNSMFVVKFNQTESIRPA